MFLLIGSPTSSDASLAQDTLWLAVMTGVLAIATVALAVLTYRGMKSSRRDADRQIEKMSEQITATERAAEDEVQAANQAADRQVRAAQIQLAAEHRPFLIEVLPDGPIFEDMGSHGNPNIAAGTGQRPISQTTTVSFENARPSEEVDPRALVVRIERAMIFVSVPLRNVGRGLAIVDEAGISLLGTPWVGAPKSHPTARPRQVPVGETTRVQIITEFVHQVTMTQKDRWTLRVPFRDYAWEQPRTAELLLAFQGDAAATGSWYVSAARTA